LVGHGGKVVQVDDVCKLASAALDVEDHTLNGAEEAGAGETFDVVG